MKIMTAVAVVLAGLIIHASPAHSQWPSAQITPDPLEFPDTLVGQTAGPSTLVVTNLSTNWPLAIFSVKLSDTVSFGIATDNCSQQVIPPLGICTVEVTFTPSASGHYEASISVINLGRGIIDTATLIGQGIAPNALLVPPSIGFGNQTINRTSETRNATLTNTGTAALDIAAIQTDGEFNVASEDCPDQLAPSEFCTIGVTFAPTVLGDATGSLSVFDNAPITPQITALSGKGIAEGQADIGFSTTELGFGGQQVGTTSTAKALTVSSQGTVALNITDIQITDGYAETDNCRGALAPGATCTVNVTFTPLVVGPLNGTITFTDDGVDSPQTVSLTGYGYTIAGPSASLSATSFDFGEEPVDNKSAEQTLTITNAGGEDLAVQLTSVDGDGESSFGKFDQCSGTMLSTGESCAITLWFLPTAEGVLSATLNIADNTADSPHAVALTGTGTGESSGGGCSLIVPVRARSAY